MLPWDCFSSVEREAVLPIRLWSCSDCRSVPRTLGPSPGCFTLPPRGYHPPLESPRETSGWEPRTCSLMPWGGKGSARCTWGSSRDLGSLEAPLNTRSNTASTLATFRAELLKMPRQPHVHTCRLPLTVPRGRGDPPSCHSCPHTRPRCLAGSCREAAARPGVKSQPCHGGAVTSCTALCKLAGPQAVSFVKRGQLTGPHWFALTVRREAGDTYLEPRSP